MVLACSVQVRSLPSYPGPMVQVQGLQSASSKITKPNDLFVECHMGFLDRLKNDVKSDARPRNRAVHSWYRRKHSWNDATLPDGICPVT